MPIFNESNYTVATVIDPDEGLVGDVDDETKYVPSKLLLGMYVQEHGSDGSATRDDIDGAIMWVGSVEPTNALDHDFWADTS